MQKSQTGVVVDFHSRKDVTLQLSHLSHSTHHNDVSLSHISAFTIPCTEQQAIFVMEVFSNISGGRTGYADHVMESFSVSRPPLMTADQLIFGWLTDIPNAPASAEQWGFCLDVCPDGGGILVTTLTHFVPDHAAHFTQVVLRCLNIHRLVTFTVATVSDRMDYPGFSGLACAVSQADIRWHTLDNFLLVEGESFSQGRQYYLVAQTVAAESSSMTTHSLIIVRQGDDAAQRWTTICHERGISATHNAGYTTIEPIAPADFAVLSRYLTVWE